MQKINSERIIDIFFSLCCLLLSIFLIIAIVTYNELDPSFNTVSNSSIIFNKTGAIGAYTADLLIQLFGIVSFTIIILFLKISIGFLGSKRKKYNFFLKIIMFIVFLISSCALISKIFYWKNYWGYSTWGGGVGYFINNFTAFLPRKIVILIYSLLTLISGYILFDFNYKIFLNLFKRIGFLIRYITILQFKVIITILKLLAPKMIINFVRNLYLSVKYKLNKVRFNSENYKTLIENQNKKIEDLEKYISSMNNNKTTEFDENDYIKSKKNESKNNSFFSLFSTDNRKDSIYKGNYKLPTLDLLNSSDNGKLIVLTKEELKEQAAELLRVLREYKITGKITSVKAGPIITLHEFEPSAGTKSSRIIGCADDIARNLKVKSTRISVISERNVVGIELPNKQRNTIFLRDILESKEYVNSNYILPIVLGSNIAGDPVVMDLAKAPHLLIAGTTGSGKSVSINTMILSLLYKFSPEECKMIMIDPKMLELSVYEGIPHLLTPVVTDPKKAVLSLKWVVNEMETRYRNMSSLGVRNIYGYNEKVIQAKKEKITLSSKILIGYDEYGDPIYENRDLDTKQLPFIVVVVDEMADLMITAGKDIEALVQRIAQMARAAGIHIIMATQRPSVDIITGVIKANFPSRISFLVSSRIDSKVILGEQGAEQLLGMGDMLYMPNGGKINRAHGPFVSDDEVERVVKYIVKQGFKPEYIKTITEDEEESSEESGNLDISISGQRDSDESLYKQAIEIIRRDKKVSISYVQRQLRIGYNKAANFIEQMEKEGIISTPSINGKRELL